MRVASADPTYRGARILSDANRDSPIVDWSTWTFDQLRVHATALHDRHRHLEAVRWVAQWNAYSSADDRDACLAWAGLSLDANRRLHDDTLWDQDRMLSQDFMLRTWIIEHAGPGSEPAWNPQTLAADTLAALSLEPDEAVAAAGDWRQLPVEKIYELSRHKDLTAHLDRLINYLSPSPTKRQLITWSEIRPQLP